MFHPGRPGRPSQSRSPAALVILSSTLLRARHRPWAHSRRGLSLPTSDFVRRPLPGRRALRSPPRQPDASCAVVATPWPPTPTSKIEIPKSAPWCPARIGFVVSSSSPGSGPGFTTNSSLAEASPRRRTGQYSSSDAAQRPPSVPDFRYGSIPRSNPFLQPPGAGG